MMRFSDCRAAMLAGIVAAGHAHAAPSFSFTQLSPPQVAGATDILASNLDDAGDLLWSVFDKDGSDRFIIQPANGGLITLPPSVLVQYMNTLGRFGGQIKIHPNEGCAFTSAVGSKQPPRTICFGPGQYVTAFGQNDTEVGVFDSHNKAFIVRGGRVIPASPPGAVSVYPVDLNARGMTAGTVVVPNQMFPQAYVLTATNKARVFGPPVANDYLFYGGLDDRGVSYWSGGPARNTFIFTEYKGVISTLPNTTGYFSPALGYYQPGRAVTPAGRLLGSVFDGTLTPHTFYAGINGRTTVLQTPAGYTSLIPVSVTDSGLSLVNAGSGGNNVYFLVKCSGSGC